MAKQCACAQPQSKMANGTAPPWSFVLLSKSLKLKPIEFRELLDSNSLQMFFTVLKDWSDFFKFFSPEVPGSISNIKVIYSALGIYITFISRSVRLMFGQVGMYMYIYIIQLWPSLFNLCSLCCIFHLNKVGSSSPIIIVMKLIII